MSWQAVGMGGRNRMLLGVWFGVCLGFFKNKEILKMDTYTSGSMSTYKLLITLLCLDCIVYKLLMYSVLSCTDTKGGSCQLLRNRIKL